MNKVIEIVIEALTKQSPEKPIYPFYPPDDQDYPICPRCTNELPNDDFFGLPKYCENCGQKLDWGKR